MLAEARVRCGADVPARVPPGEMSLSGRVSHLSEAAGADAASPMAGATPVTLYSLGPVLLADDTARRFSRGFP